MATRRSWLSTAAALTLACTGVTEPETPGLNDVAVGVGLSMDQVALGDTVEIAVSVTNLTTRRLLYSTSACPITIEFISGSDPPAFLTPPGCILRQEAHELGPREQKSTTFFFDGTAWRQSGSFELSVGSYDVVATVGGVSWSGSATGELQLLPRTPRAAAHRRRRRITMRLAPTLTTFAPVKRLAVGEPSPTSER